MEVLSNINGKAVTLTSVTDSQIASGRVVFTSTGGLLIDDSDLTYNNGTQTLSVPNLSASGLKGTGLTSGRVPYATTGGLLTDDADLAFDGTLLAVGSGDAAALGATATTAQHLSVRRGTVAAPDTNLHPPVKVERHIGHAGGDVTGDGAEQCAGLLSVAIGSSTAGIQPIGLMGVGKSSSAATLVGSAAPDAVGVYGVGRVLGSSTWTGIGGYFNGRRDVDTGKACGVEIQSYNGTATPGTYNSTGFSSCLGLWVNANGIADGSAGIVVSNPFGYQFSVGLGFTGQITGGKTGGAKDQTIRDDGNAITSYQINGSHTYGIDLKGGTFTGAAVRFKQGDGIKWRNVADSADQHAVYCTSNILVLGEGTSQVQSQVPFYVNIEDAGTNNSPYSLNIRHNSSGTPTAGFGSILVFGLKSSTTNSQNAASVNVAWSDATHATRTAYLQFDTVSLGGTLAERARIDSGGITITAGGTLKTGGIFTGTTTAGTDETAAIYQYVNGSPVQQMHRLFTAYTGTHREGHSPLEVFTQYRSTTAPNPFLGTYSGLESTLTYGYQAANTAESSVAAVGTVQAMTATVLVRNSGDYEDEHVPLLLTQRYDNTNNGFPNATPGRGWVIDANIHGAIEQQQGALGGIHLYANNHYNGPPRDGASCGYAAVTYEAGGGGKDEDHRQALTYPMGFGYGVMGSSSGALTRGWETGIRVGGSGSNWNVPYSHLGTGIEIQDCDNAGIRVNAAFSGMMNVTMTHNGTGYTSLPVVTFGNAPAGGINAGGYAVLTATTISQTVGAMTVSTVGNGYANSTAYKVLFSQPYPAGQQAVGKVTSNGSGQIAVSTAVVFADATTGTAAVTSGGITSMSSITGTNTNWPPSETAIPVSLVDGSNRTAWGTAATNASGNVTAVTVTRGGTGYTAGSVTISPYGSGYTTQPTATVASSPAGATANIATVVLAATTVARVRVSTPGKGYVTAPSVTVAAPTSGTTATAVATIPATGCLPDVYVTAPGSNYSTVTPPVVTFTGGLTSGTPATLTAVVSGGAVTSVTVGGGGTGYLASATFPVTIVQSSNKTASGAAITNSSGVITSIVVTNASSGSGYTAAAVTLEGVAAGVAEVSVAGKVTGVFMTHAGGGYTSAPAVALSTPANVTATGTPGMGVGKVTVTAGGSGYTNGTYTGQSFSGGGGSGGIYSFTVTAGAVASVTVTTAGTGYTSQPTVSFAAAGAGSGATATSYLKVVSVALVLQGSGYYGGATITFTGGGSSPTPTQAEATAGVYYGLVKTVTVTDGGSDYQSVPAATFSAPTNPTGATASASLGRNAIFVDVNAGQVVVNNGNPASPNTGLVAVANKALAADVTTTSTTAVDVTGLNFTVGPNEVWSFEAYLNIGTSSNAGTKYAVTFPAGATVLATCRGTTTAATAETNEEMTASGTLTTTAWNTTAAITTAAVSAFMRIASVVRNGATAGTVQIQHAKVTSGTATVYANSYLTARRIS